MNLITAIIKPIVLLSVVFVFSFTQNSSAQQFGYLGKGKDQYSLFVFGDALAGGLWSGTSRITKRHPRLTINGRYREGSGLAKPRIYNWPKRLPKTLENRTVDIAVVFIGTNDAQDIRKTGEYLAFNSDQWKEVYTKSVTQMMTLLTANKTAVYWVEVPPVRRSELDERLKVIAKIHQIEAAKAGIRFVKIRKPFSTEDGKFAMSGASIAGNNVRLRSRNGIRFIKAGNNKLASIILKQIELDIEIADGDKPASKFPVPDESNIASLDPSAYVGPVFGYESTDKAALIVQPLNMPLAGVNQTTNVQIALPVFASKDGGTVQGKPVSSAALLKALASQTKTNSPAHTLFQNGQWPNSQAGRLDDFSRSAN